MMGLIVSELYDALVDAGASPDRAKAAAGAVPSTDNVSTKEDIARIEARFDRVEANMATKEELAKLEARLDRVEANMVTKEELAKLEARLDRVEANMVTKEDFARLDKQVAVLRLAVFGFGSTIVGLLVKLAFFP
ncbi:MAG: hypothetical protein OXF11_16465 [Deltaproteobacteria bacterium]|nr:hypothetical protein [Deltaproteobacteria bacterium]